MGIHTVVDNSPRTMVSRFWMPSKKKSGAHTRAYAHARGVVHLRQLVITGTCIGLNSSATMQSLGCVVDDRDGQRLVGTAPRMGTKQPNEMRRLTALTHSVTGVASAESPARGKPAGASTPMQQVTHLYIRAPTATAEKRFHLTDPCFRGQQDAITNHWR